MELQRFLADLADALSDANDYVTDDPDSAISVLNFTEKILNDAVATMEGGHEPNFSSMDIELREFVESKVPEVVKISRALDD